VKFEETSIEEEPEVGLVNGLAWTSVGGEITKY
jgi:ATP-dependent Lon protease